MPLPPSPPIESSRLWLRIVEAADLPDLLRVNGDDEVTRYLPYASWQSPADGTAWFERMSVQGAAGEALQFVLVEKASASVIGSCLLFRFESGSARAELGYVLGRQHWGRGFMQEALSALIDSAFGVFALRRLEAQVDPRNGASHRLLLKLGFTHEGLMRQRWVAKGDTHDTNFYGLLCHEWPQGRSQEQPQEQSQEPR